MQPHLPERHEQIIDEHPKDRLTILKRHPDLPTEIDEHSQDVLLLGDKHNSFVFYEMFFCYMFHTYSMELSFRTMWGALLHG
ncbi:hypothetical protein AAHH80_33060, partial [Burkholderia pseudomallei]